MRKPKIVVEAGRYSRLACKTQKLFEHLKIYLTTEKDVIPYQDMAAELEMTETSVRVAVHRLRRQYRKLLRDEIAQTVGDEGQIEEEMGCLLAALAY